MGKPVHKKHSNTGIGSKPSQLGARMRAGGRRLEGARCDYTGPSGKTCARKASAEGKCTLHVRRLAGTDAHFFLEFIPLEGSPGKLERKGPYRAPKANQMMAALSHQRAELTARGYTVRQVRA